jgi:hypothetical protein
MTAKTHNTRQAKFFSQKSAVCVVVPRTVVRGSVVFVDEALHEAVRNARRAYELHQTKGLSLLKQLLSIRILSFERVFPAHSQMRGYI